MHASILLVSDDKDDFETDKFLIEDGQINPYDYMLHCEDLKFKSFKELKDYITSSVYAILYGGSLIESELWMYNQKKAILNPQFLDFIEWIKKYWYGKNNHMNFKFALYDGHM